MSTKMYTIQLSQNELDALASIIYKVTMSVENQEKIQPYELESAQDKDELITALNTVLKAMKSDPLTDEEFKEFKEYAASCVDIAKKNRDPELNALIEALEKGVPGKLEAFDEEESDIAEYGYAEKEANLLDKLEKEWDEKSSK